jgi:hypothetical protein
MTPERTQLEWTYNPAGFFEVPYEKTTPDFHALINDGKVVVTLTAPIDPVPDHLELRIQKLLEGIFLVRQLQIHQKYALHGPTTHQYLGGRTNVSIRAAGTVVATGFGRADIVVSDATGKILRDSKAERIAEHQQMLDVVAPKLADSTALRTLIESYSRSVSDPEDELVHLYEIRDALSQHYGGERQAREVLGISQKDWQRLGFLANVEPLEQGRHRGKHLANRRVASSGELQEARELVRQWIIAFAHKV